MLDLILQGNRTVGGRRGEERRRERKRLREALLWFDVNKGSLCQGLGPSVVVLRRGGTFGRPNGRFLGHWKSRIRKGSK
jgi:hypothetical protein